MPGIYNRPMFQMARGGMLPEEQVDMSMMVEEGPAPQPQMPPEMMQAMQQMTPEMMQQVEQDFGEASNEAAMEEVERGVGEEVSRSMNNLDMAGDMLDIMNTVWDDNRTIEDYRTELASVVGPEDASRTPDSVLALVQPTLQLAQIDQGIGALMQEELAEIGGAGDGGGITDLATKAAVADGMAAETGALVNAVGGMSQAPQSMDELMMAAVGEDIAPMPMGPEMV